MHLVNTDRKLQNDFRLMPSSSESGTFCLITYRGLFSSILCHRQKSQLFRLYIASRYHTILTRLFFKMFLLNIWHFVNDFVVVVHLWLMRAIHMNTYINCFRQLTYFMKNKYSLFYNIIHDMATTINMHTII